MNHDNAAAPATNLICISIKGEGKELDERVDIAVHRLESKGFCLNDVQGDFDDHDRPVGVKLFFEPAGGEEEKDEEKKHRSDNDEEGKHRRIHKESKSKKNKKSKKIKEAAPVVDEERSLQSSGIVSISNADNKQQDRNGTSSILHRYTTLGQRTTAPTIKVDETKSPDRTQDEDPQDDIALSAPKTRKKLAAVKLPSHPNHTTAPAATAAEIKSLQSKIQELETELKTTIQQKDEQITEAARDHQDVVDDLRRKLAESDSRLSNAETKFILFREQTAKSSEEAQTAHQIALSKAIQAVEAEGRAQVQTIQQRLDCVLAELESEKKKRIESEKRTYKAIQIVTKVLKAFRQFQSDLLVCKREIDNWKRMASQDISRMKENISFLVQFVAPFTAAPLTVAAAMSEFDSTLVDLRLAKIALKTMTERYLSAQTKARQAHNQVQDLKGNVRVFCRVRPSNKSEKGSDNILVLKDGCAVGFLKPAQNALMSTMNTDEETVEAKEFGFDRTFAPYEGQAAVFQETEPLLTSAIDGYNVCIFAYGQTGSGKTHTILGSPLPGNDERGLTFRAIELLWNTKLARPNQKIELSLSMFEIYNEALLDVLAGETKAKIVVMGDPNEGVKIAGLSEYPLESIDQAFRLLEKGTLQRTVASTKMNERSSRSHLLILIKIRALDLGSERMYTSKLYLVDLAGSEDVSKSGATGTTLREAANINKSLSALHDVMGALAKASPHVPFRNSRLTHVLADSLGGQAKTLMYVMVSGSAMQSRETLASLHFAARCKAVVLGPAVKEFESANKKANSQQPHEDRIRDEVESRVSQLLIAHSVAEQETDHLLEWIEEEISKSLRQLGEELPKSQTLAPLQMIRPSRKERFLHLIQTLSLGISKRAEISTTPTVGAREVLRVPFLRSNNANNSGSSSGSRPQSAVKKKNMDDFLQKRIEQDSTNANSPSSSSSSPSMILPRSKRVARPMSAMPSLRIAGSPSPAPSPISTFHHQNQHHQQHSQLSQIGSVSMFNLVTESSEQKQQQQHSTPQSSWNDNSIDAASPDSPPSSSIDNNEKKKKKPLAPLPLMNSSSNHGHFESEEENISLDLEGNRLQNSNEYSGNQRLRQHSQQQHHHHHLSLHNDKNKEEEEEEESSPVLVRGPGRIRPTRNAF